MPDRFDTPLGPAVATLAGGRLTGLKLVPPGSPTGDAQPPLSPALIRVREQLLGYLAGDRAEFEVEAAPEGTPFQVLVWREVARVPYGRTVSYAELARRIGRPGSARAVGAAVGRNPVWIVVPCHRVVGSDGSPTGYAGGIDLKRHLLRLEAGRSGPPTLQSPAGGFWSA